MPTIDTKTKTRKKRKHCDRESNTSIRVSLKVLLLIMTNIFKKMNPGLCWKKVLGPK